MGSNGNEDSNGDEICMDVGETHESDTSSEIRTQFVGELRYRFDPKSGLPKGNVGAAGASIGVSSTEGSKL